MADWRAEVAREIERAEQDALAEVDAALRACSARVRDGVDLERQRLRAALLERSKALHEAGERAAVRAVELASSVEADERAAARAHAAALRAFEQLREAARALADEVRAAEGELAVPIARAQRRALQEALPELRRIVAEAAHRSALDQRADLELLDRREGVATWRRRLADAVRSARASADEQADGVLRAARDEVDRAIEAVRRVTDPMPARMLKVVDERVPVALRAAVAVEPPRPRWWLRALALFGSTLGLAVVVGLGVLAMGLGVAVGGAVIGALLFSGTFAPPVTGGLLAGFVACLVGALVTDLVFGSLGDWREGISDGLLGAVVARTAAPARVELGEVLAALRLPPLVLMPVPSGDRGGVTDPGRYAGGLVTSTLFGAHRGDEVDPDEPELQ